MKLDLRLAAPLLAAALLAGAWPALAGPSELPLAVAAELPGSGSFGLRIDAPDGVADVDLYSVGPKDGGSTDGIGLFVFRGDHSFLFGIGVSGGLSTDRTIVQVGDVGAAAAEGVRAVPRDGAADAACAYNCMYLQIRGGSPPSTFYVVAWVAGLAGPASVEVHGNAGAIAAITTGTSLALGDPEIQHGTVDVQVQRRVVGFNGAGAKAMVEARATAEVAHALYGFWGFNNVKFACAASACLQTTTADAACRAAGVGACDPTRISWQGPAGAGADQNSYAFLGAPAGPYTFQVDRKLDAYQPGGGAAGPGFFAVVYENASFLTVADVALP